MFLHKLLLKDFRLFSQEIFEFDNQVTVVVAPNAGGKSTIIEAIHLLASGKSFRASKVEEMVSLEVEIAQIKAKVFPDQSFLNHDDELGGIDEMQLAILLTRGVVNGKRTQKQHFCVNDNKRRKKDFVGNLLAVVFRPEDMRLIEGSPSRRREYFDSALTQVNKEYQASLSQYEKILRQRNKLLFQIREGSQSRSALTYWNMSLVKHGEVVQEMRKKFAEFINAAVESSLVFQFKYLPSIISEKRVAEKTETEIAAGFSLIGPHKDDFEVQFILNNSNNNDGEYRSLDAYGSRGQKRMGVLWLKKAELAYLKQESESLPILLLDDILSELDETNRKRVLELVNGEQIIITTADQDLVSEIKRQFESAQIINLQN